MRQRRMVLLLIATCFLSACQPVDSFVSPTQAKALPPPKVYRTANPSNTPPDNLISPTPIALATPGTLSEMARSVYGPRLIDYIQIPAIRVNAPVTPVGWHLSDEDQGQPEWDSPDAQVGWAVSSALPGDDGNIILYGHNNIDSSVFKNLGKLQAGDRIILITQTNLWEYQVRDVNIIPVSNPEEDQQAYQKYFRPTDSAQLTLISCWPPTGNSYRVIITAEPVNLPRN